MTMYCKRGDLQFIAVIRIEYQFSLFNIVLF